MPVRRHGQGPGAASLRISTATTDAATHQAVGSEQGGTTPTHAAGGSKGDVSYGVLAAACVGVAAVVAAVAAVVSVQQRRRASGAQGSRAPRADSMAPMTDNPGATMEDDKAANAL